MTFVKRRIEAVVSIARGAFGEEKGFTVRLAGLRMAVRMNSYGADAMGQCQMRIYGMPLHLMNELTTIGPIAAQIRPQSRLIVMAGDEGGALATVFDGTIGTSWVEMSGAPDVPFNIAGYAGLADLLRPVPVRSYNSSPLVQDMLSNLADVMGLSFENNGVNLRLNYPYLSGTALTQVRAIARASKINYVIERGVLAIWPMRGGRGGDAPIISRDTGMVGYPTFTGNGVTVQTIFTPNAKQGGHIDLRSDLTPANGKWNIAFVQHDLSCLMPGGPWFTNLECVRTSPDA